MNIKSLEELKKFAGGSPTNQAYLTSNIKRVLWDSVWKLKRILQRQIEAYYDSYDPKYYKRTYMFQRSLRTEEIIANGNEIAVRIYFDEKYATHPSVVYNRGKKGEDGFVPILLNYGWRWRKNSDLYYHFSTYEGFNFVEKAVNEFNTQKHGHIKITLEAKHGRGIVERRDYYAY
jgi:hypothetical protein